MINKYTLFIPLLLLQPLLYGDENLENNSLEDIMNIESNPVVSIDSHGRENDYFDAKAAVDVITAEQIEHSGYTSLTDVLRYFIPGFNAPEPSLADGSDHLRAFTLRGMSGDQTLVLINGKRLHRSALLHVNTTIGRGSNNADLDTIPIYAIDRIEILRDGAAAQYGSDAIAGVINIILKGSGHTNTIAVQSGKRDAGDGEKSDLSAFVSIPLQYDGFLNLTAATTQAKQTQRAGADRRLTPPEVKTHYGLPDAQNYQFILNGELPFQNGTAVYSNLLLSKRTSEASAFFRAPESSRAFNQDGFLPVIQGDIEDYSLNFGLKGELPYDIHYDISQIIGANTFIFHVNESMNYSLGAVSPTSFYNGKLFTQEATTNLDLKRHFENGLDLSLGGEYRAEKYTISAGDTASYTGTGSQGFAGFQPRNATDTSRDSYALYLDGVWNFTSQLSTELAGRYERYSDFGTTTNVKLAGHYKLSNPFSLRASVSTGFRAPSLAQSNYSLTSSYINSDGVLSTQGTFKTSDPEAVSQGATPLKPEQSEHLSVGAVYQLDYAYIMVDYFYTKVNDKIMLSDNLPVTIGNITAVRFFTNAIDTKTQGIDLKAVYNNAFEYNQKLDISLWYHYDITTITKINSPYVTEQNSLAQLDAIENSQPNDSQRLLLNYKKDAYNVALNLSRFGSFSQVVSGKSREFDPIITTDVQFTYSLKKYLHLSLGGNNIFNAMPNKWKDLSGVGLGYDGIVPYSEYSPTGFSGAFYYLKASVKF